MRQAVLAALLVPYVYYGGKDAVFHFRGRRVSSLEHALHLALGVGAAGVAVAVFTGRREALPWSLALLLAAGALDEFVFHKELPEPESDLHAKSHWGLLLFVVVGLLWT